VPEPWHLWLSVQSWTGATPWLLDSDYTLFGGGLSAHWGWEGWAQCGPRTNSVKSVSEQSLWQVAEKLGFLKNDLLKRDFIKKWILKSSNQKWNSEKRRVKNLFLTDSCLSANTLGFNTHVQESHFFLTFISPSSIV
jgi:hypothetical protein